MMETSLVVSFMAIGVLGFALFVTIDWARRHSTTKHNGATPPWLPYRFPILYHTFELIANADRANDWATEKCEQYAGKPFVMKIMGKPQLTVLNRPELFEDVLKTQFDHFEKGVDMCENLCDVLGQGIFAVDGSAWMHQRKTASNLFTARSLRDSMAHSVRALLPVLHRTLARAAESQTPIDLVRLLNRFTMEGFAKIGFGVDLHCLEAEQEHPFQSAFDNAQRILSLRFIYPRWYWKAQRWLNIGPERELKQHIKVIDDTVLRIIGDSLEARQRSRSRSSSSNPVGQEDDGIASAPSADIVSLFLDDVSADVKRGHTEFDPRFLRDIVVNFLIAGRDTTAQALSWFFYELSLHPHVEKRIRDELCEHLPFLFNKTTGLTTPSLEQVHGLVYLEAALRETLRLHPSVPSNFKRANRDTVLCDGTFIPKGTSVGISSYPLGRMTHVWGPDAKSFRPERWMDPQQPGKLITVSAFKFNAFFAGPRMCLGMNLAMMEMKLLIASVLSQFRLDVVPDQNVTYQISLTLPMKGPLLTRVIPVQ